MNDERTCPLVKVVVTVNSNASSKCYQESKIMFWKNITIIETDYAHSNDDKEPALTLSDRIVLVRPDGYIAWAPKEAPEQIVPSIKAVLRKLFIKI